MGSLALTLCIAFVIGIICIRITLKSTYEPDLSWECVTCGGNNAFNIGECSECGMERPA
jgi:RNase P subunit RPR2